MYEVGTLSMSVQVWSQISAAPKASFAPERQNTESAAVARMEQAFIFRFYLCVGFMFSSPNKIVMTPWPASPLRVESETFLNLMCSVYHPNPFGSICPFPCLPAASDRTAKMVFGCLGCLVVWVVWVFGCLGCLVVWVVWVF